MATTSDEEGWSSNDSHDEPSPLQQTQQSDSPPPPEALPDDAMRLRKALARAVEPFLACAGARAPRRWIQCRFHHINDHKLPVSHTETFEVPPEVQQTEALSGRLRETLQLPPGSVVFAVQEHGLCGAPLIPLPLMYLLCTANQTELELDVLVRHVAAAATADLQLPAPSLPPIDLDALQCGSSSAAVGAELLQRLQRDQVRTGRHNHPERALRIDVAPRETKS